MASLSQFWGTDPKERDFVYACDRFIEQPDAALYRGVTIHAPAETVFRWLCQLRVAPYSYDLIDNYGRQSPRELTPGIENLVIGQDVMGIFDLVEFEQDRHLTIRVKAGSSASRTFGDIVVSYVVVSGSQDSCRLLVKLIAKYSKSAKGQFMRRFLPWGDLIMMRRQLLNLKKRAEQTHTSSPEGNK